ncbi:hypothetical protein NDU88_002652 [Pleurodeles waltl]|uniref:Uncharacterized protein n=1 Tax=Pleurodeles waltl TaxID=8319 RepID=A0AAV7TL99_PLEWA|nr:hypothetical protein NDU88_002652 [Pleurodeles waltl]
MDDCSRSPIGSLKLNWGCIFNTHADINNDLIAYYWAVYSEVAVPSTDELGDFLCRLFFPRLDLLQWSELNALMQIEEIRLAMVQIAQAKASGMDSLPIEYYFAFDATLSTRLLEMCIEVWERFAVRENRL